MFVAVPSGSDLFCTGFQLGDLPSAAKHEAGDGCALDGCLVDKAKLGGQGT